MRSNSPSIGGPVPPGVVEWGRLLLVVAADIVFVWMFVVATLQTWRTPSGVPHQYTDAFLYVATALSALIGGVVAVGFGQKPPPAEPGTRAARSAVGLGRVAALHQGRWQEILATVYVISYLLLGVGAIATWVARSAETPEVLKNLATTFLGMMLPIVAAYFSEP